MVARGETGPRHAHRFGTVLRERSEDGVRSGALGVLGEFLDDSGGVAAGAHQNPWMNTTGGLLVLVI
jgi:hypothetical protein